MCGIIYCKSFNDIPVRKNIIDGFSDQRSRGTSGFGFVEVCYKDEFVRTKRFIKEEAALKHLGKSQAREILFHHRIPTSSANDFETNHPIIAKQYDVYEHNYYLVHNGTIGNYRELKDDHEKLGIKYSAVDAMDKNIFNDSESLLHELALIIENKKEAKDFKADGNIAFIMLQTDMGNKPVALYYGRNGGSPLTVTELENSLLLIKSEGALNDVSINVLHRYDYKTKETTKKLMSFGSSILLPPANIREMDIGESSKLLSFDRLAGIIIKRFIVPSDALGNLTDSELMSLLKINTRILSASEMELEKLSLLEQKGEMILTYDGIKCLEENQREIIKLVD